MTGRRWRSEPDGEERELLHPPRRLTTAGEMSIHRGSEGCRTDDGMKNVTAREVGARPILEDGEGTGR
jgi:hypothetical protein